MCNGIYLLILIGKIKLQVMGKQLKNLTKRRRTNIIESFWIVKTVEYEHCTSSRENTHHYCLKIRSLTININRLMSAELLSKDRRVEKHLTPQGFEPTTSHSITRCTAHSAIKPLYLFCCNRFYISKKL